MDSCCLKDSTEQLLHRNQTPVAQAFDDDREIVKERKHKQRSKGAEKQTRLQERKDQRDTRGDDGERLGPSKPSLMIVYPQATASCEQAQTWQMIT
jgi:hypothetical protein